VNLTSQELEVCGFRLPASGATFIQFFPSSFVLEDQLIKQPAFMKYIFAFALLFPLAVFSQQCSLKKELDQFSQKPKITTGFMKLGSGTLSLSIDATATDIDFLFTFSNKDTPLCFDDASTVAFHFDSTRSRANFRNSGSMNCEGVFHMMFRNTATTPYGLNRLGTTKVAAIKITGTDKKMIDINLTNEEKEQLMKMVSCIATEAKTLLQ
jgi:hypothetical protein